MLQKCQQIWLQIRNICDDDNIIDMHNTQMHRCVQIEVSNTNISGVTGISITEQVQLISV